MEEAEHWSDKGFVRVLKELKKSSACNNVHIFLPTAEAEALAMVCTKTLAIATSGSSDVTRVELF